MSNTYLPPGGIIEPVDGNIVVKKFPLPSSARAFPSGSPLWNNGASGVEPALQQVGTATSSDAAMAALVTQGLAGIALEARVAQQLSAAPLFNVGGDAVLYPDDASKPHIPVATEGIFEAPYHDTLNGVAALAAQHEIGEYVQIDGFENTGTQGFYGPDGVLRAQDTNFYLYNNCVKISATQDAAHSIGRLVERALVGATNLKFKLVTTVVG